MIAYVYALRSVSNFIHLSSPTVLSGPTSMPKNLRMLMSIKNTIWACNGWQAIVLFLASLRTHLHCLQWQLLGALEREGLERWRQSYQIPAWKISSVSTVMTQMADRRCIFLSVNLYVSVLPFECSIGQCTATWAVKYSRILRKYLYFILGSFEFMWKSLFWK